MEAKATTKTISNGTLGLRFMQNALRAKQMKEVEAERAPVKDDGEWEVDQKIRDAWNAKSSASSQTVTYESSYLPFLFSSEASTSSSGDKPKGRRVFNKHGVEEAVQEAKPEDSTPAPPSEDSSKRYKVHPRPKTISGGSGGLFGFPDPDAQSPKPKSKSKDKNKKTAKEAIYDNTGVGEDIHPTKQHLLSNPPPGTNSKTATFLKPAGVDDPLETKPKPSPAASTDSDIIQGARGKKLKRERPGTDTPTGDDSKRKKKKKKVQEATS
ncbi:hypothetical protein H0H92_012241 [Tricholoma furcatifolium]|nr:hypothetical protein H0H92_012241 [Tricholoma furcatifolium]